jgi:predicted dehydrogenase
MYKIGILGSDNSHCLYYSQIINSKDEKTLDPIYPDFKVTHIFGLDEDLTKERAQNGEIAHIVKSPEEMIGKVDAVIVVFRHGDLHAEYTIPFVKLGLTVFLDKPFTIKIEDIKSVIEAAEISGSVITGGSTYKYTDEITKLKNHLDKKSIKQAGIDKFVSAQISYYLSHSPEYGGIHFYGPHTVDSALYLFGYDVRSVYASAVEKNIYAVLKYDTRQIILNFMYENDAFYVDIIDTDEHISLSVPDTDCYRKGMLNFMDVIRNGKSDLTNHQILMSVAVMNAVELSLTKKREIYLTELI